MANAKELKDRIRSVGDTRKITNAMYLIASMKMRKAKAELDGTRPYFEAIRGEIKRIFRTVQDVQSRRSTALMPVWSSRRTRVWRVCITRT